MTVKKNHKMSESRRGLRTQSRRLGESRLDLCQPLCRANVNQSFISKLYHRRGAGLMIRHTKSVNSVKYQALRDNLLIRLATLRVPCRIPPSQPPFIVGRRFEFWGLLKR